MDWMNKVSGILQQYSESTSTQGNASQTPADVSQHFDNVAQTVPQNVLAQGLSEAFHSKETPALWTDGRKPVPTIGSRAEGWDIEQIVGGSRSFGFSMACYERSFRISFWTQPSKPTSHGANKSGDRI